MTYSESPPVSGTHLRAVDPVEFGEPTPEVRRTSESTVLAPASTEAELLLDEAIPIPRGGRRHTVPPRLEDYPDVALTTPDRASRTWVLPTTDDAGFNTLAAPIAAAADDDDDDDELSRELGRLDLTRSLVFHGTLIGMITTRRTTHICEFPHDYAPTTLRCAGCRWFETRVFRLDDADSRALAGMRYALHYVGRSIVPGEVDLPRHELVRSGHEVVEAYTVRKRNEPPFITKPGARVLAQAAKYDPDVEDAYVNRATA